MPRCNLSSPLRKDKKNIEHFVSLKAVFCYKTPTFRLHRNLEFAILRHV